MANQSISWRTRVVWKFEEYVGDTVGFNVGSHVGSFVGSIVDAEDAESMMTADALNVANIKMNELANREASLSGTKEI